MNKKITLTGILSLKGKGLQSRKAFTLVELIVVITIIAILGTIAFISLQGYSENARDSTRVSDIQNIKTSLELFQTTAGKYPDPTNGTQITYLGAEVWNQGIFGEQTFTNVGKLNKLPKDPLTEREYSYSVLNTKIEYEIGAIYESYNLAQNINNEILNTTYAGTKEAIGMITGNYNGILAKVSTGSTLYVLAVPTIIGTKLTDPDLLNMVTNNNLAYNGYNNLPASYEGTKFNTQSSEPLMLVNPANLVIYSGSIKDLSTGTGQIAFINGLQSAYTGTTIAGLNEIGNILSYDTVNDIEGSQLVAQVLIQQFIDPSLVISGMVAGGGEEDVQLKATRISAGAYHACVLFTTGGVKCWGYNGLGQLGDGTTTEKLIPTQVDGLETGVLSISLGDYHTCALTTTGGVKCWGSNNYGQLGDNSIINKLTPTDVSGLTSGVSSISLGGSHTCVLLTTGGIKCWGINTSGQLGDNTIINKLIPTQVSSLTSGISAISLGESHTCALLSTGGIKCWGTNFAGQLGDNTTTTKLIPTQVSGLTSGISAISLGDHHTCALTTTGGVKCWGHNVQGQIGDNTTTNKLIPTNVSLLTSGISAISLGDFHTCALTTTGGIKCWGNNASGQLGDNSTTNILIPTDVEGLTSGISGISLGSNNTCALLTTGGVKCWGYNIYGQLGDGTKYYTQRLTPVESVSLENTTQYATSIMGSHNCILTTGGGVKCWGPNTYGQIGDGTTSGRIIPTQVSGLISGVSNIYVGYDHTCALLTAGGVKCWGNNTNGQLGDNTIIKKLVPTQVSGLTSGVNKLALGYSYSCALLTTGGVKCWGINALGQLGDNSTTQRLIPVQVFGLTSGISNIHSAYFHACALTTGGGVKCWGENISGQLGDNTTVNKIYPTDVSGLTTGVSSLSVGRNFSCALTTGGGVKCWGDNTYGELGDGTTTRRLVPTQVSGLITGISSVSLGYWHSCALSVDGGVKCWGQNSNGQLGDGTEDTNRLTPVDVIGLSNVSNIYGGNARTCARQISGAIQCWGNSGYGLFQDGYDFFLKRDVVVGE